MQRPEAVARGKQPDLRRQQTRPWKNKTNLDQAGAKRRASPSATPPPTDWHPEISFIPENYFKR
jgi:hypothetical protein